MAYLQKEILAGHLIAAYKKQYGRDISPLKLQKTLYLLYAMWGGNIRLLNKDISSNEISKEVEFDSAFDEELFEAKFEAWKYGPVDREIYISYKNGQIEPVEDLELSVSSSEESTVLSFVKDIYQQAFEISDFALVDLTHKDQAWISKYNENEKFNNSIMNNNEIIEEYALRFSEE